MSISVPLLHSVDLAIYGATTAAVTAAIAAREAGVSVVIISDRPGFGEESAASLAFLDRETPSDPLLGPIFASAFDPQGYARPGAIKHGLEKALLEHEVPFLFLARPVALLPDAQGAPAGLLVAARTALYAIEARVLVDASPGGLLANLAGRAPAEITGSTVTTLAIANPGAEPVGKPFAITHSSYRKKEEIIPDRTVQAYRFTHPGCQEGAGLAKLAAYEHKVRPCSLHPAILHTAEATLSTYRAGAATLPENLLLVPGADSSDPDHHGSAGRQVGAAAAALAKSRPAVTVAEAPAEAGAAAFRFAPSFHRGAVRELRLALPEFPALAQADVVVAGGGTGGAPAGIAAARAGARTVVLEMQRNLGGVGTLGTIACYYFGNLVGFTQEMDAEIEAMDPDVPKGRWNPSLKAAWYEQRLAEAGGEAWLGSFAFGVRLEGSHVNALLVSTPYGAGIIEAGAVIDATGSADIAAAAGAPCRVIGANHAAVQGAGLSPRRPGDHYINSDFTFIDDDDVAGVTHAFVQARARFINDFDTIPFINTRERRQIVGEVELSPLDFLTRRNFPDTITTAISNFDTHGFTIHPVFLVTPPDKKALAANIPYRCFVPQGVDGLLVIGLGMSAHRDALPVIRMQGDVQNQGYAAGYAAVLAIRNGVPVRHVPMPALQAHLVEIGILTPEIAGACERAPFPQEAIREAANKTPVDFYHTALLMEHPQESIAALRERLAAPSSELQREEAALILGLLGDVTAAPVLAEIVASRDWDAGWNYRGMGQYGMSCSRLDAVVIALGRTGSPLALEPLRAKIEALVPESEFSHCRAVAVAASYLGAVELAEPLATVLASPTFHGHAMTQTAQVVAQEPTSAAHQDNYLRTENAPRTLSLRELYLARAIYLCGDRDGLGRATLEAYSRDLRGLYARHAQEVLAAEDKEAVRRESI